MPVRKTTLINSTKSAVTLGFFIFLLLSAAPTVFAAAGEKAPVKKLFSTSDTLEITMHAPWRTITKEDDFQGSYPAKLEYTDESGNVVTLEHTVERRGITRQRVCAYPPIKLRFDKETVKGTEFEGQKSLKMVTHCQKGSKYEQYYIQEMLIYQMYNLITDFSFKVRPLLITYADSKEGKTQEPRFAFLIEDDSDVAKRNGQKKLDITDTWEDRFVPQEAATMALFQYMIANVDWASLSGPNPDKCCHNTKLIGLDPEKDIYAIPYDFDSSGLVNAEYAAPPDNLKLKSVTQRLYRGFCIHNPYLAESKQLFLDKEDAIYALIDNESRLTSSSSKRVKKFIGKFYDILNSDKDFDKKIIGKCRK
jgi:hypothetical protein